VDDRGFLFVDVAPAALGLAPCSCPSRRHIRSHCHRRSPEQIWARPALDDDLGQVISSAGCFVELWGSSCDGVKFVRRQLGDDLLVASPRRKCASRHSRSSLAMDQRGPVQATVGERL
jgi:hypothetical protein